jgi:hypothetical protein
MSGKTYIEKKHLLKTLPENAIIPVKVKGLENDSSFSELEDGYILLENFKKSCILTGGYTPTVTGILNGGTVTFLTDVRYTVINGVTEIKATFQVELDAASSEEQFDIDLDALIEPTVNFSDASDVIGGVVPFTLFVNNVGGNVYALATTKKVQFLVRNDGVGETLKLYFSATYNI